MVTSDFRPDMEIRPVRACAMHPEVEIRNASGHNYWNSSFIIDMAMGQLPRSTERISSYYYYFYFYFYLFLAHQHKAAGMKIKLSKNYC